MPRALSQARARQALLNPLMGVLPCMWLLHHFIGPACGCCRYAALNKLLGRNVYSSHMQLGGPRVMGTNGVSHHIVADDLEGCAPAAQMWLQRGCKGGHFPVLDLNQPYLMDDFR